MPLSKISFREKRIDRRIAAYQSDLIAGGREHVPPDAGLAA